MVKASKRRACVFCGGTGLTAEHVFPRWIQKLFPTGNGTNIRYDQRLGTKKIWYTPDSRQTAVCVCKSCNNGWMSHLEETVRPLLTPLIFGQHRELDEAEQRILATWCLKTVLMQECASSTPLPVGDHYTNLYLQRHPSPQHLIWLTAFNDQLTSLRYMRQVRMLIPSDATPRTASEQENRRQEILSAYISTISIVKFVAQIVWTNSLDDYRWILGQQGNEHLVQIWPTSISPVVYPKTYIPDISTLDHLARRFIYDPKGPGITSLDP